MDISCHVVEDITLGGFDCWNGSARAKWLIGNFADSEEVSYSYVYRL